jgi:hypothetical protein
MLQLAPVLYQAQFTHRHASFFQARLEGAAYTQGVFSRYHLDCDASGHGPVAIAGWQRDLLDCL